MESVDLAMLHKETSKSSVPDVASMSVGTLEVSFSSCDFSYYSYSCTLVCYNGRKELWKRSLLAQEKNSINGH